MQPALRNLRTALAQRTTTLNHRLNSGLGTKSWLHFPSCFLHPQASSPPYGGKMAMRTCRIYLLIMHPHPTAPQKEEFSLPSSSKTILELILSDFDEVTAPGLNQPQCTSHGRRGPEEQRRPTPPTLRMGEECFHVGNRALLSETEQMLLPTQ